jgi:protein tyrosine phosphatase (PTP) superfamily phosphohydrolase (DUF442 family)
MSIPFRKATASFRTPAGLTPADVATAAESGVRPIVDKRSDHEKPGQPVRVEIASPFRLAGALVCAALVSGALATAVAAQEPAPRTAAQVAALKHCLAVSEDAARLACLDQAAKALVQAEESGDVAVVDRAQVNEVKRQSFGFNIGLGPLLERGSKSAPVNELTTAVERASLTADGKWLIRTTEGQVWRQIDSDPLFRDPRKGDKVVIRRGAFGSFLLTVANDRAMRAHRDE